MARSLLVRSLLGVPRGDVWRRVSVEVGEEGEEGECAAQGIALPHSAEIVVI